MFEKYKITYKITYSRSSNPDKVYSEIQHNYSDAKKAIITYVKNGWNVIVKDHNNKIIGQSKWVNTFEWNDSNPE